MTILQLDELSRVTGGAGAASQQELRDLARRYCPQTYAANKTRPITRPLAERCLEEAGYGAYKSMLDRYFPSNK